MKNGITRRRFLKYSLAPLITGFSLAVNNTGFATISSLASPKLNGVLSYYTFASLLGQWFKMDVIQAEQRFVVKIRLDEVVSVSLTPGNDQFYLVFKVLSNTIRPNGTYRIRHVTAGSTKLFLQNIGDSTVGNYCRADFNLLT